MESYTDLEVWKQAKDLVRQIYELSKAFPKEEQFGLTNQPGERPFRYPPTSLKVAAVRSDRPDIQQQQSTNNS